MHAYLRLYKIFEIMWLVASFVSLTVLITRAMNGESYGNYIYITIFTASVAVFMYYFKKKNRKYMEKRYKEQEEKDEQLRKGSM